MEQVLLVVQVLLAVGLIGMVLIQRSDSDGFGLSGGSGNNLLSGRSTANLMTRTTAILAGLFIINSLALSVLAAHGHAPSIAESIEKEQSGSAGASTVPDAADAKAEKTDAKKTDGKADEKTAPSVPAADADIKPAAPVKKPAKKPAVPASESDESASESTDNQ